MESICFEYELENLAVVCHLESCLGYVCIIVWWVAWWHWVSAVHVQWEWLNIKAPIASRWCANIHLQKVNLLNFILCCANCISLIRCVPPVVDRSHQIGSSCYKVSATLNGWLSRMTTNGGLSSGLFLQSCTSTNSGCCGLCWDTISRPFYCIHTATVS